MTFSSAAVVRLALLGLLGGILQLTAVSQITIFGVPSNHSSGSRVANHPRICSCGWAASSCFAEGM